MRPRREGGTSVDAARLKTLPLFGDLAHHDLEKIARWADEVDVRPGKTLVTQGSFPHEFMVIESGTCDVTVDGQRIAELGPGDFFGEMALLEHQRRSASVTATRSEEHTSELQSRQYLVCRLLLEKKT